MFIYNSRPVGDLANKTITRIAS